jgi:hypothetical protein
MLVPKKRRQDPTHSQMGNPYPPGLEPAILQYGMPGVPMECCSMRPLVEAEIAPPGGIVADYLYIEPDPQWPRLRLRLAPRGKRQTDAQYEAYRRGIEAFTCTHSIILGLCQELCTLVGNHLTCKEGPCRRSGCCSAIRDQDRFDIPLVLFPPCVPLDLEIIDTYRQEIIAEIKRTVATGNEVRPVSERSIAPSRLRAPQRPHN